MKQLLDAGNPRPFCKLQSDIEKCVFLLISIHVCGAFYTAWNCHVVFVCFLDTQ